MSVVNNGWIGGGSSMADAISKGENVSFDTSKITAGPLAEMLGNVKTAAVAGNRSAYDDGPASRMSRSEDSQESEVDPEDPADGTPHPSVTSFSKKKPKSRSAKILARVRGNENDLGDDEELSGKEPNNLPAGAQMSSGVGSGPQGKLIIGSEKLSSFVAVDAAVLGGIIGLEQDNLLTKMAAAASTPPDDDAINYIGRDDPHALYLFQALNEVMGSEWREWDSAVIKKTLTGMGIDNPPMSKIMALKMIVAKPEEVTGNWRVFEKVVLAINGYEPNWERSEEVDVPWISNAVAIISFLLGGPPDYSDEIDAHIAATLADQGYVLPPSHLAFADNRLKTLIKDDGGVRIATAHALADGADPGEDEDPVSIQVRRILSNNAYVIDGLGE